MKKEKKFDFKHYWLCMNCAKERGGKFPEGHCCTVTISTCPYCGVHGTIIPYVDFDWEGLDTKNLRD